MPVVGGPTNPATPVNTGTVNPTTNVTGTTPTGATSTTTTTPTGGTVPAGGGNVVNARKVTIGGLGAARMDASATTNRFSRDPSFDAYAADPSGGRVGRGFIKTDATPIPGGCRLHVESFHGNHNDSVTLYLLAEVLDAKTNQLRTVTLSVLANGENLNGTTYRGNTYFDISYDDVNKWLQAKNPALKLTPGATNLAVAARWSVGHQAGGFGRGGVFRLPPAANTQNAVSVRSTSAAQAASGGELQLDMQVNYPTQLVQQVPNLKPDGAILSRLESELKGCTTNPEMISGVKEAYRLTGMVQAGKQAEVEKILGKDWTIAPVSRYWLKDDGSASQPGKAGTGQFKGFRVDDKGWPMQDPMHDTYMDNANMDMTAHEGAIRLRTNKQANEINVKPGGGRRDDKTKITQRIEYGLTLNPTANVAQAAQTLQTISGNGQWSGTVFNQAQREVSKLDSTLNLAQCLVPWCDVVQERHKFTVKNQKTGVEIELSLDFVKVTTNRPQHANPDGSPRVVEFCVLEAELDHLQLQSSNQANFVAPSSVGTAHFTTDAEQDNWLRATSPTVTMDIDPRLHEVKDLENKAFRETPSYKAFEGVSDRMLNALFPNGLTSGRQKAAHAAEMLGLVCFSDAQLRDAAKAAVENAGFTFGQPVQQCIDHAIANDPAKRRLLQQGLANGTCKNVPAFLQQLAGFAVALDYDIAKLKGRVSGRLAELGMSVDPAVLAMFDGATTQKLQPNYLESYLQQMQNYQDAQVFTQFAQTFGVSPVPPVKVDVKKLLASSTWGESAIAARLEQAAIDKKYVADIAKFIDKATAAGMTAYEARTLVQNLASNPQQRLDQIGQQRNIAAEVPKLRASVDRLAALAEPNLKAWYFKVDDEMKKFLGKIADTRTPQEAVNFVAQLRSNPETVINQEATRLGVTAPTISYDWAAVDAVLVPQLQAQSVAYDDPLKKLVKDAVQNGVPVQNLQYAFQSLGQMTLAAALKQRGIYLVGVAIPTVKYDPTATETNIRNNLASYSCLPQTNELNKWIDKAFAAGMTPAQVQNYATYFVQYGKHYADQQKTAQAPSAGPVPEVPLDLNAFCNAMQARWTTRWTTEIDTFVRAELGNALAKAPQGQNFGLYSIYQQQPPQAARLVAQHSGVALPAGI
ncbi:MAG: hypothetical protein HYS27_02240 [Deltaproteobacteria bacterium]|nr:hypothetical protein [Deltaproteobacteria bacterium]